MDLHEAIEIEDVKRVSYLIEQGVDVDYQDYQGYTALHIAVFEDNVNVLKYLIAAGADLDSRCEKNLTPLFYAVENRKENSSKLLLEAGANVRVKDKYDRSLLYLASEWNNKKIVKMLIKRGADVNKADSCGCTPLFNAVASGDVDLLKILLDAGANPNIKAEKMYYERCMMDTPLLWAARSGNEEIVQVLLNANADVNVINSRDGASAVNLAFASGNSNVVKILLEAGADVNSKTTSGRTLVHQFAELADERMLKFVLEAGADVNAKNSFGITPLQNAIENFENIKIVKILIDAGADVDAINWESISFLISFVQHLDYGECRYDENEMNECFMLLMKHMSINKVNGGTNVNKLVYILCRKYLRLELFCYYKFILERVAMLKASNFQVDPNLIAFIHGDHVYSKYFYSCLQELEKAKKTSLEKCWVTFFNLIVDDESKFVKYAGNNHLVNDYKKRACEFPIYRAWMQMNLSEGINSRKSFDTAANVLSCSLPIFDPFHLVIRDTLQLLNANHWKNLCE